MTGTHPAPGAVTQGGTVDRRRLDWLLVEFTRTLMHEHMLPDQLFEHMESEFARAKFVEAVGLLGHYITIGTVIRLFEVEPPEGTKTF